MNGFERRKERKRESIRRGALELFQAYGFRRVSINDIAHKAGVSPVTIYNHFGSKEELVRDIVKTLLLSALERYRAVIEGEQTFLEKLEIILFDKTELASQYQGELIQTVYQNDPEMKQFVETVWQQDVNQLTIDLLEEGRREGYVNTELSQEALLLYLEILRNGVSTSSNLLANIEPNVKFFRELNYLFLYGLVGKKE